MLNFLRRIVIALGLLVVVAGVTLFLVTPTVIIDLATRLNEATALMRTVQAVIALLVDALLLVVIYRVLRPVRDEMLIVRARGAKAAVSIDSVQRQINARLSQVSDVLDVQNEVEVEKGSASVTLYVRTRPDIRIPEKQKEINRVLHQLVEKQMGLRMAGPPVLHLALAAEEFGPGDHVTTVVEPLNEATAEATYTAAALPATTYTESSAPAPRALNAPAASQSGGQEKEPWQDFLLGDDS